MDQGKLVERLKQASDDQTIQFFKFSHYIVIILLPPLRVSKGKETFRYFDLFRVNEDTCTLKLVRQHQ